MGFTVAQILEWTGGRLANEAELGGRVAEIRVDRPTPLAGSRAADCAFFFNRCYEKELPLAAPGVLITAEPFVAPMRAAGLPFWKSCAVISCPDPYLAMAILSGKFAPGLSTAAHVPGVAAEAATEVHPTAKVAEGVKLANGVKIGPYCVIEEGASLGARTVLYAGCFVGPKVSVGEDTVLFPNVVLYEWTQVGSRVRIHAGAVLGADGFGYAPIREPKEKGGKVVGHQKIYHLGRVIVEDDVEIGANTCVDRGTFGETRVSRSAKLDNLVQVGHNARVDEGGVICGSAALAGNSSVGRYAYVGGLTGITNQVHVGDGASVAALALVSKDVPPGGTAVGNPQREYREHFKAHAALNKLASERKGQREKGKGSS